MNPSFNAPITGFSIHYFRNLETGPLFEALIVKSYATMEMTFAHFLRSKITYYAAALKMYQLVHFCLLVQQKL